MKTSAEDKGTAVAGTATTKAINKTPAPSERKEILPRPNGFRSRLTL